MDQDDAQLAAAHAAGRAGAFAALHGRHAGRVRAYFLRSGFADADADDLTQETFVRVHRSLHTFDPRRGRFAAWLATIARNLARRAWRRRSPEHFDPELAAEVLAEPDNPAADPQHREQLALLRGCVAGLPADLAAVIRLRYVEARTTRGIGAALHLPEATVRLRLDQARQALARCLAARGVREEPIPARRPRSRV